MRLLFVTNTVPFPPRNGVELPLAHLISHMAKRLEVDLLVLSNRESGELAREAFVPENVRVLWGQPRTRPVARRVLGELVGLGPGYFQTAFDTEEVAAILGERTYDLAWVTPVSEWGFVRFCRAADRPLARAVALGLNDVTTTLYAEFLTEQFAGRGEHDFGRLLRGLRTPWIAWYERAYLKEADLVHVQTELEARRLRRLVGRDSPAVVVAPNGRKEALAGVVYRGHHTRRVLYMTHLDGVRARESRWFLRDVWPRVKAQVDGAELWLVGTPPEPGNRRYEGADLRGVRALGYVDDLAEVFESIAVAVVPIYHGTGLINRVQDALSAGVPLVGTGRALATVPGLEVGRHALQGDAPDIFAEQVVRILRSEDFARELANGAKALGDSLPTWEASMGRIERALAGITGGLSGAGRIGRP